MPFKQYKYCAIFVLDPLVLTDKQVKVIKMIKVASVILLSVISVALSDDGSSEIELNEKGCPVDFMIFKILPHEECNKFYKCAHGQPIEFQCPANLMFNLNENVCDWPNQVNCERNKVTSGPETTVLPEDADPPTICARAGSDGLLVPHEYCSHLYMCARGVPIDIKCPDPLLFNTESKLCDWESEVNCGERLRENRITTESPEK